MNFNLLQAIGFTSLFYILSGIVYYKIRNNQQTLKWMTKLLLFMSGILLFININLYVSVRADVHTQMVIRQYSEEGTLELLGLLHDTKNHTAYMENDRIYIDKGTDKERIFLLTHEPYFTIVDQAKSIDMARDLMK